MEQQFTLGELAKLKEYSKVALHKIELDLRKVRRNKKLIQERYDRTPQNMIVENGIMSPIEMIESLKSDRKIARMIQSKVSIAMSNAR